MVDIIENCGFPIEFVGARKLAENGVDIREIVNLSEYPEPYIQQTFREGPIRGAIPVPLSRVLCEKACLSYSEFWTPISEEPEHVKKCEICGKHLKGKQERWCSPEHAAEYWNPKQKARKAVTQKPLTKRKPTSRKSERGKLSRQVSMIHTKRGKYRGDEVMLTPARVAILERSITVDELTHELKRSYRTVYSLLNEIPPDRKTSINTLRQTKRDIEHWLDANGIRFLVDPLKSIPFRFDRNSNRFISQIEWEDKTSNRTVSSEYKKRAIRCYVCGRELTGNQRKWCSERCRDEYRGEQKRDALKEEPDIKDDSQTDTLLKQLAEIKAEIAEIKLEGKPVVITETKKPWYKRIFAK